MIHLYTDPTKNHKKGKRDIMVKADMLVDDEFVKNNPPQDQQRPDPLAGDRIPGFGGMLGGMMGAMGGMSNMAVPPSNIDDTIYGEAKEIPVDDEVEAIEDTHKNPFIELVTPINVTTTEQTKDGKPLIIATVHFLCKDSDNSMFIVDRNLFLQNKEDIEIIGLIPFAEDRDSDFLSKLIEFRFLQQCLPMYGTDFNFFVDEDFDKNPNPVIHLNALDKERNKVVIDVRADSFASMAYIDSFIFEHLTNYHDLNLAVANGARISNNAEGLEESPASFFVVDSVDQIVSMASAVPDKSGVDKIKALFSKETSTNIGVVTKVTRYIGKDNKESAFILVPFDAGVVYPKEKFRGKTIQDIQDNFYGDADQYVSTYMVSSVRLHGVDKEYTMIRGKTKDRNIKLFLFDSATFEELTHKVEEF